MKNLLLRVLVLGALLGFSSFASAVDHCEEIHNLKIGDEVNLWLIKDGKKIQIDRSIVIEKNNQFHFSIIMGHKLSYTKAESFKKISCVNNTLKLHEFSVKYENEERARDEDEELVFNYKGKWIFEKNHNGTLIINKKTSLVTN
jgi:hypothetical protein